MFRLGLLTLMVLLASAASASANIYTTILRVYETKGTVPACQFSSQQLERAIKQTDTYDAQYFGDFTQAMQGALQSRASGTCSPAHRALAAPGGAANPGGRFPSATAATSSGLPATIVLLGVLTAIGVLVGALMALARWRGWSPRWAGPWRHMWSEAGERSHGTWDDFGDWFRSG